MSSPAPSREKARAALVSVSTALLLTLVKTSAWLFTGSVSLLASAADSLMDVFASFVNLVAVRVSDRPPDECHRYGHGKAEGMAGFFQSLLIGASAGFLAYESCYRIFRPIEVARPLLGVAVMVFSMAASVLLVLYLRRVAARHESLALRADSVHYLADILANGGVIAALAGYYVFDIRWLDPLVGLAISILILRSVFFVFRDSMDNLMDRELPAKEREKIQDALRHGVPGVRDFHGLRTRRSGSRRFVDVHVELDRELSFVMAHEVAEAAVRAVEGALPNCRATVHADPWPQESSGSSYSNGG